MQLLCLSSGVTQSIFLTTSIRAIMSAGSAGHTESENMYIKSISQICVCVFRFSLTVSLPHVTYFLPHTPLNSPHSLRTSVLNMETCYTISMSMAVALAFKMYKLWREWMILTPGFEMVSRWIKLNEFTDDTFEQFDFPLAFENNLIRTLWDLIWDLESYHFLDKCFMNLWQTTELSPV